jgi:signal transduction histidine kinase
MTTGVAAHLKNKTTEISAGLDASSRVPGDIGELPPPSAAGLRERVAAIRERVMEHCVPAGLERNTEPYRRARLITGFGLLGFVFGCFYAAFYEIIGHIYGAEIITVCSVAVAMAPFLLRATGSIRFSGNVLTLTLLLGFTALCGIEGGVRGHAIGWLAAVPLCALLLVEGPEAVGWCFVSVVVTFLFVLLDFYGVKVPVLYPAQWHNVVTAVGYLGLTTFMTLLGVIFEGGRRRAFARMEAALREVSEGNARLKKLDAEKNEFLGVAAHDLKNPLNIVMGFAEMIATGRPGGPDRVKADARYIIEAAERMIALITQLLDVNAIEQGRFPLELEVCDLGKISSQVATSYATAAERKRISLFAAGPMMPAWVLADSRAAYRILDNLLSNAIKYSPPGGDIFVRIRNGPEGVAWEVQDQGAGLTAADQARLFQKFTKLSARPTAGESSTGLGLSIVKMLAVQMHGTVECKSIPGHGATFCVHLPTAQAPAESVAA